MALNSSLTTFPALKFPQTKTPKHLVWEYVVFIWLRSVRF